MRVGAIVPPTPTPTPTPTPARVGARVQIWTDDLGVVAPAPSRDGGVALNGLTVALLTLAGLACSFAWLRRMVCRSLGGWCADRWYAGARIPFAAHFCKDPNRCAAAGIVRGAAVYGRIHRHLIRPG